MKKTYLLLDLAHLLNRARHVISAPNPEEHVGLVLHTVFNMISKMYRRFQPDHLVVALEGRSWRYNLYPEYKSARKVKKTQATPKEIEIDNAVNTAFNNFMTFLKEDTRCSVLQNYNAEADDLIARFVVMHPDDKVVLVSSDMDFIQLLKNDNLTIYDGIKDCLITKEGVFNERNKPMEFELKNDGKVSVKKNVLKEITLPRPDWLDYSLFCKCIRGDNSDSIKSAYPRVSQKGTKNKIGIDQAYDDMKGQGFTYNNFMNQTWEDPFGNKKVVKECYNFNRQLIDLEMIPQDYKTSFDISIAEEVTSEKHISMIGIKFLKFIKPFDLRQVETNQSSFVEMFSKEYPQ